VNHGSLFHAWQQLVFRDIIKDLLFFVNDQVSVQKGFEVILKDNFETGLSKGYDYVNKG